MTALIEPSALHAIQDQVKILDATYGAPNAKGAYEAEHIGNAQFFDIDYVADPLARYPHTLPSPEDFAIHVGRMGISNDDKVVIYDQNGISFAAARTWWMFRVMGHKDVRVLNGGLPAWRMAGLPLQSGSPQAQHEKYTAHFNADLYRSFEQMEDTTDKVIDARAPARFNASIRTRDNDVCTANIPGSENLDFTRLLDERGRMKASDELKALLAPYKNTPKISVSCGSGVTACVLALGFYEAFGKDVAVFDGSWTEWADRNGLN